MIQFLYMTYSTYSRFSLPIMGGNAPRPHLWIDDSLAGQSYQDNLPLPAFLAGVLREIMLSKDFPEVPKVIQRKVSHLSFLLHLLCRFDNFSLVYEHYCQVKRQ